MTFRFLAGLTLVLGSLAGPSTSPLTVRSTDDLQQALNAARPGDIVQLEAGATFVGNFYLPAASGSDSRTIVLRTAGSDAVSPGERMTPDHAHMLAKIRSSNDMPALRTSPRTAHWRLELLEFVGSPAGGADVVTLGDGSNAQSVLDQVPTDLVMDRVYVHGEADVPQKRGIALNSANTNITNSYISEIKGIGQDTQAIAAWNGPGSYLIENNYLEAAGENVLLGGADPAIIGLTPADVVIRGNTITKPIAWRGTQWQVKNLFELKNSRDVVVEKNVFERNWQAAQSGYAILFTVRNQDGGCGWCQVENIQFRQNTIRDVAAGVQILGVDSNHPSRQTNGIVLRNNLFDGIDSQAWGGDGYFLQFTDNPRDITIDHNTVIQGASSGVAKIDGHVDGLAFTNNVASHGEYGIIAADHGIGNDSIRASLPGANITANVLAGGNRNLYPPGNLFPSVDEFRRQFVNFGGHDYRLIPGSSWIGAASDGTNLGADLSAPLWTPAPPRRP